MFVLRQLRNLTEFTDQLLILQHLCSVQCLFVDNSTHLRKILRYFKYLFSLIHILLHQSLVDTQHLFRCNVFDLKRIFECVFSKFVCFLGNYLQVINLFKLAFKNHVTVHVFWFLVNLLAFAIIIILKHSHEFFVFRQLFEKLNCRDFKKLASSRVADNFKRRRNLFLNDFLNIPIFLNNLLSRSPILFLHVKFSQIHFFLENHALDDFKMPFFAEDLAWAKSKDWFFFNGKGLLS